MIADFAPSNAPRSKIIAQELLAHLGWSVLYPFGIRNSRKQVGRQKTQRTVVFIHGYIANRSSFYPLAAYLHLVGVKQKLYFNYSPQMGVEAAAVQLKKFIQARIKGGRIDLVCHSLGGLIALCYLYELGGARRVDRCLTLGTPHGGTYSSYWMPTDVAKSLRPDSQLITRLSTHATGKSKVKHSSIIAGSDNIVVPRVFATGAEDVVHIPDLGHVGLLFSPKVFQAVASRLLTA